MLEYKGNLSTKYIYNMYSIGVAFHKGLLDGVRKRSRNSAAVRQDNTGLSLREGADAQALQVPAPGFGTVSVLDQNRVGGWGHCDPP
jgi:hypothetical protein